MTSGGIVAVGDSITNACSADLVFDGVPARSWVEWVALTLGEPLTTYAMSGADSSQILGLLPSELPHARLGFVFAGVNNTISWRRFRTVNFEESLTALVSRIGASCERVIVVQVPHRIGVGALAYGPRLTHRIQTNRRIVTRVAQATGADVVDPPELYGNQVWLDKVHPTSTGHLAYADAVLDAIGAEARASSLSWDHASTRPDMDRWKRSTALRFALKAPALGLAGWVVGR